MKTEVKDLIAEVSAQISLAQMMGYEPDFVRPSAELFVSYLSNALNYRANHRNQAEALDNLRELRDDMAKCLARHGMRMVKSAGCYMSQVDASRYAE